MFLIKIKPFNADGSSFWHAGGGSKGKKYFFISSFEIGARLNGVMFRVDIDTGLIVGTPFAFSSVGHYIGGNNFERILSIGYIIDDKINYVLTYRPAKSRAFAFKN